MPEVARQLDVSHVLEGSVRKAGGRVRITAQLIDGAAGDHVWAERYDRDLTDIFALQDEISEAIVAALKLKLLPEEKKAIERRGTDNADAYNLYLMARSYYLTGNDGDPRRDEAIERLCPPGRGDRSRLRPGLGSDGLRRNTPFTAAMGGPATAARPPWTAPWPSTPIWPRPARSRRGCCPMRAGTRRRRPRSPSPCGSIRSPTR